MTCHVRDQKITKHRQRSVKLNATLLCHLCVSGPTSRMFVLAIKSDGILSFSVFFFLLKTPRCGLTHRIIPWKLLGSQNSWPYFSTGVRSLDWEALQKGAKLAELFRPLLYPPQCDKILSEKISKQKTESDLTLA